MDKTEEKNRFLKKINELDLKIENEKMNIKHNNLIKEELNKINESYNRCLNLLARSVSGKNINQKHSDLYAENRTNFVKEMNNIDSQLSESQKNIEVYIEDKKILKEQYKEETDKDE